MKTLVICEKPASAVKIAQAIAENGLKKRYHEGVPYYELKHDEHKIIVASALGHLFTLKNLKPMKSYPFYEIGWIPVHEASRRTSRTRNFSATIQALSRDVDNFVVATDFDNEGSLIGYNALRYLCGEDSVEKAKRMKFSTLTAEDLALAYEHASPRLDFGNVNAGMARHVLDWYWGMNLSLAMSLAVKAAENKFVKISAGRVQTPTLKILADREREIAAFKAAPFWVLKLVLEVDGSEIAAEHDVDRFWEKDKAERALAVCSGATAIVSSIHKHRFERPPPAPFNLGALQSEAYRCFGFSPMRTQKIAQELYQAAIISYPRTDSQKLPPAIGYARIIGLLGRISIQYKRCSDELLASNELRPNEGSKVDPAHPSIYPTGEKPEGLVGPQKKIYDLIVRRFFSVFGRAALIESTKIILDVNEQIFRIDGQRLINEGWMKFYDSYVPLKDSPLPPLIEGQELPVKKVMLESKETQPPARYNPTSILKEMESRHLGTKGTRAQILQNLYSREYIFGNQINVTDLGLEVIGSLLTFCPEIASENLTGRFEKDLEIVQVGGREKGAIISEAQSELDKILGNFKKHELEIGKRLARAYRAARIKRNILGKCQCGGDLRIIRSRATQKRFVGCSNYPTCNTAFPLPQSGDITLRGKICTFCHTPIIKIRLFGKRPYETCLDPKCRKKP